MNPAYDRITDAIIASLEGGVAPWVKPWSCYSKAEGPAPFNMVSKRPYRGINTLILGMAPFTSNGWATFKQVRDNGGKVRKGEHGSMIVYYDRREVEDKSSDVEGATKVIPMLKTFIVFNREQCEFAEGSTLAVTVQPDADATPEGYEPGCEATLKLCAPSLSHAGDKAFYVPVQDRIQMPAKKSFHTPAGYWATLFHEMTHWTSHASRCNRDLTAGYFGNPDYAFEELVAELGSAFLCASHGVDGDLRHAGYIKSWLKALHDDKRVIFKASALAQKAADWIAIGGKAEEQQAA